MHRQAVILHVLDDLETGGTERQVAAFLVRSDPARFCHEVCALAEGGRFAQDLEAVGIPIHVLGVKTSNDMLRSILRLSRLVGKVRPDLIHATLFRPGVVSRIVGWMHRTPVVTTLVNTTYEPEWLLDNPRLNPRKVRLAQILDAMTSRIGTHFTAMNRAVKSSAVQRLGIAPGRIAVIQRGLIPDAVVASSNGAEGARAAFGWADVYPLILNVGRLVPQKGQRYAILAMREVIRRYPSARLIIAGTGPLQGQLEDLVRAQRLEGHVTLLGDRRDVPLLLQVSDLFVLPSIYEGAANALMEAMAAGKPCVASRIPTLREITGDGAVALLAELRSPDDFAGNLLRLAEDRTLGAQMGRAAQAWVQQHFDMDASVQALQSLYEDLVRGRMTSASPRSRTAGLPGGSGGSR
ncbi:MAG: glycosyltransferase [bacterium]